MTNKTTIIFLTILISFTFTKTEDWDIYWRDYKGTIPKDAVSAEPDSVFVGQVIYEGFLIPGSIYARSRKFVSEYYGKFEVSKDIKILCAGNLNKVKWKRVHVDNIPENLLLNETIEGGFQNDFNWYIGKSFHENQWRVGKVNFTSPHFKGLNIWNNDGSHFRVFDFQVLIYD